MPRVNIYIHVENVGLWEALPNKSAWVNERLAGNSERSSPAHKPSPVKRAAFNQLKKTLDAREGAPVYKKTQNWGA